MFHCQFKDSVPVSHFAKLLWPGDIHPIVGGMDNLIKGLVEKGQIKGWLTAHFHYNSGI